MTIRIDGADPERSVEWLKQRQETGAPPPPSRPASQSAAPAAYMAASGTWRSLSLRLHLEQPVIVPARVVGNVVETRSVIPGTYLLGAVAHALRNAGRADAALHIQAGSVMALTATPEVAGQRGLPAPAVIQMRKEGGDATRPETLVNRLVEASPGVQLRGWRGDFVTLPDGATLPGHRSGTAGTGTAMHNSIDDVEQRAKEAGGVYTYQHLAAGQVYRSEIRWRTDLVAEETRFVEALAGQVKLGMSRRDDYGACRVEPIGVPRPHVVPATATVEVAGRTLLPVWLTSDALLRDEALRPSPTVEALKATLETALAVPLEHVRLHDRIAVDCRTARYETWHDGWSLPRPSLVALAGGSCVAFAVAGTLDADRLAGVMAAGIGERRAEGYGQVLLGPELLCSPLSDRAPKPAATVTKSSPAPLPPLDAATSVCLLQVTRAAWMAEIERVALASMADSGMADLLLAADTKALQTGDLANLRGVLRTPGLDAPGMQRAVADWANRILRVAEKKKHKSHGDLESHLGPGGGLQKILDEKAGVDRFWRFMTRNDAEPFAGLPMRLPVLEETHGATLRHELFPVALQVLMETSIRRIGKQEPSAGSPEGRS